MSAAPEQRACLSEKNSDCIITVHEWEASVRACVTTAKSNHKHVATCLTIIKRTLAIVSNDSPHNLAVIPIFNPQKLGKQITPSANSSFQSSTRRSHINF